MSKERDEDESDARGEDELVAMVSYATDMLESWHCRLLDQILSSTSLHLYTLDSR